MARPGEGASRTLLVGRSQVYTPTPSGPLVASQGIWPTGHDTQTRSLTAAWFPNSGSLEGTHLAVNRGPVSPSLHECKGTPHACREGEEGRRETTEQLSPRFVKRGKEGAKQTRVKPAMPVCTCLSRGAVGGSPGNWTLRGRVWPGHTGRSGRSSTTDRSHFFYDNQ